MSGVLKRENYIASLGYILGCEKAVTIAWCNYF